MWGGSLPGAGIKRVQGTADAKLTRNARGWYQAMEGCTISQLGYISAHGWYTASSARGLNTIKLSWVSVRLC